LHHLTQIWNFDICAARIVLPSPFICKKHHYYHFMKPIIKHSLLALAGITATTNAAMASDNFVAGDIGIAFYAFTDSVVEANTYVLNLGQASLYRENTQTGVAISTINTALASSNIGADLVATFGANWAEDGRVRWAVVGGVNSTDPLTSGDPPRTNYISRGRASLANGATGAGTTISSISSTNRGILSNNIQGFFTGTNDGIGLVNSSTSTSGVNVAGAVLPISNINSVDEFLPPSQLTYFGVGIDPRQTFATGAITGSAAVEGALDLYRILHSTSGADLTAGASTGNAAVGAGQFIGTLTIDATGNLKIAAVGAANPDSDGDGLLDAWEVSNFGNITAQTGTGDADGDGATNEEEETAATNPNSATSWPDTDTDGLKDAWEVSNFGNIAAQNATGDNDGDGTNNLTEFRLGLNPVSGNSRFAATRNGAGLIQWPSVVGVTFTVERSTTLAIGSWTTAGTVPGTAGTASFTPSSPAAGKEFYRVLLQP
jgi:hypothetical protein